MRLNMKQIYTFLALIFCANFTQAQISWDNMKPDTVFTFETTPDVEVHNKITFADSGTYRWVREFVSTCPITSAICDKNTCYLETVDSAVFFADAKESFTMIAHFYPNNNCCKHAKINLHIYKIADPKVKSTAEYNISLWCSSLGNQNREVKNLSVYPNPCTTSLEVSDVTEFDAFYITDQLGRKMIIQTNDNSGKIDVSALNPGYYVISFLSEGTTFNKSFIKQ